MSSRIIRNTLIGLEVVVGIMAIYGSIALLYDARGLGVEEDWLRGSPFSNYQVPALTLLVGVGGSAFLAGAALLRASAKVGALLSIGAGLVLVGFEIGEGYWFGLRNAQQPFMFVVGLLVACLGAMLVHENIVRGARRAPRVHAQ